MNGKHPYSTTMPFEISATTFFKVSEKCTYLNHDILFCLGDSWKYTSSIGGGWRSRGHPSSSQPEVSVQCEHPMI